ncbi:hypothetical protein [Pinirhizobacter soli]|uniref:hypothetical protein n=1 Tax=Pinirhizobacter soli TaxID=2786953 RepID=UPI00202A00F7|nr:hypothetical protein [Pinirhizobacter soli]
MEAQLAAVEVDLLNLLKRVLPRAAHSGEFLFFNSEFMPDYIRPHWLPEESEVVLSLARESLSLRDQLQLPAKGTAAQMYLSACTENSNVKDEHRRGSRQLAAWLLGEL